MISSPGEKVDRRFKGMPQTQTAANSRHQEEEKKDKNIHAQNKQTNVREAQRPAPSSPSEVIRMLKQPEKRGHRAREDFKTLCLDYKETFDNSLPPWITLSNYHSANDLSAVLNPLSRCRKIWTRFPSFEIRKRVGLVWEIRDLKPVQLQKAALIGNIALVNP